LVASDGCSGNFEKTENNWTPLMEWKINETKRSRVRPGNLKKEFDTALALLIYEHFCPGGVVVKWYRLRLRRYGSWDRIPPGW
jgi:hypothetical protein